MRKYSPVVHKHQLADVDQRHGPLKDWGVESLVLGTTPPVVSCFPLHYWHYNYWGWLKGSVHPNYNFSPLSLVEPAMQKFCWELLSAEKKLSWKWLLWITQTNENTFPGKTQCCWLFQCHFFFSVLSSTIIWVNWPIKSTDERNCCCTKFNPVQYI